MSEAASSMPDATFTHLRTQRLVIRRFAMADAVTLSAYRSDPDVARYQSWDAPFSEEDARRFIQALAGAHPDTPGEWFQFAVTERSSGVHVGDLAAFTDGDDPRLATVGFTLARAVHGRGYATEALTALLDYLFIRRAKHRVSADCDVRNTASVALLERVGMRREAHHISNAWWNGEWTDEYVYAVLDSEWPRQSRQRGARA